MTSLFSRLTKLANTLLLVLILIFLMLIYQKLPQQVTNYELQKAKSDNAALQKLISKIPYVNVGNDINAYIKNNELDVNVTNSELDVNVTNNPLKVDKW